MQLDPTRLTTQAMDQGWDGGAADAVDGRLQLSHRQDPAWRQRHPGKPVIGTETGSTVATRGAYANDAAAHVVRAYDTEHPWWASTAEEWWKIVAAEPGIAGGFIWTGFDYRGEPTPYPQFPSVSSYFGAMDLCGFPKDNYYYYRAWWRRDRRWSTCCRTGTDRARRPADRGLGAWQCRGGIAAQWPLAGPQGHAGKRPPRVAGALCPRHAGSARLCAGKLVARDAA
jgi:hypothetical protein